MGFPLLVTPDDVPGNPMSLSLLPTNAYRAYYGVFHLHDRLHWTPGLPLGVHSNHPCPSVRLSVRLSLNISETAH